MAELRRPRDVPDLFAELIAPPPFTPELDTDGDGLADTAVTDDGIDLVVTTDLDGDGLADQVLRIGPDGVPRRVVSPLQTYLDGYDQPAPYSPSSILEEP